VRCPDGKIKLFCKGADTVILERLAENQPFTEKTLVHLEDYATEGLRTLCIAARDIPEAEYRQWVTVYDQAAATLNGRGDALDAAAELIEKDLKLDWVLQLAGHSCLLDCEGSSVIACYADLTRHSSDAVCTSG